MAKTSIEDKYKSKLTSEEQETHIHYDYFSDVVKIRTTFYHVYKAIIKRLDKYKKEPLVQSENPGFSYYVEVDINNVRNPFTLISSKHGNKVEGDIEED